MNKLIYVLLLALIVLVIPSAFGALDKDDIMGDPAITLAPILPEVQWLTGTTLGFFLIAGVLGIIIGGIIYFAGAGIGSSAAKSNGVSGVIGCLVVGLIVSMALTLFISIAI